MATIQELELSRQLVLLYHASICPFATDQIPQSCRSFTNCGETRSLLQHTDNCDEDDCPVPNCEQSRFLLGHFQICVDDLCVVCKPLRENIQRKKKRSYNVVLKVPPVEQITNISQKESPQDEFPLISPRCINELDLSNHSTDSIINGINTNCHLGTTPTPYPSLLPVYCIPVNTSQHVYLSPMISVPIPHPTYTTSPADIPPSSSDPSGSSASSSASSVSLNSSTPTNSTLEKPDSISEITGWSWEEEEEEEEDHNTIVTYSSLTSSAHSAPPLTPSTHPTPQTNPVSTNNWVEIDEMDKLLSFLANQHDELSQSVHSVKEEDQYAYQTCMYCSLPIMYTGANESNKGGNSNNSSGLYRYHCDDCNKDICFDCFHYQPDDDNDEHDGDKDILTPTITIRRPLTPHEHPIRAIRMKRKTKLT